MLALSRSADIDRAYRRGTLLKGAFFHVRALRSAAAEHRTVIITPKKIFRDAVDRNRMTRRTRALLPLLLPKTPYDIVILPRKEALHMRPAPLREDMEAILRQLA